MLAAQPYFADAFARVPQLSIVHIIMSLLVIAASEPQSREVCVIQGIAGRARNDGIYLIVVLRLSLLLIGFSLKPSTWFA
jgi:hypothetical protein